MIHVDTSLLVDALTGPMRSAPGLRRVVGEGTPLRLSSIALFEWLRCPRHTEEIDDQQSLFPVTTIVPFGPVEAATAAEIYRGLRRARSREADVAIAATAIAHGARLWTLDLDDFRDIPGLSLFEA